MSYATIRSQIATLIGAVSGIGQVHEYRRNTKTWEEFYLRHVDKMIVNNWEISRTSREQESIAVQDLGGTEPFYHDTHQILIIGHMSVRDEDATEKTFQDLIDAIVTKIRQNFLLGGLVLLPRSLQVPTITHKMYGGVLVHYAELTYEAIERVGG